MVKSGLEDRFEKNNDVPRVSQYRLASHLTLAFVLYAMLLRAALEQLSPALHWPVMSKSVIPFKILAHSCKGLVYFTAISGMWTKYEFVLVTENLKSVIMCAVLFQVLLWPA